MEPEVWKDFCMAEEKITTNDEWDVKINDEPVCQYRNYKNTDL